MSILLESAGKLVQPSLSSAEDFEQNLESMVNTINQEMASRKDIDELIGADNLAMMKNNHANQARFLLSLFHNYVPEVLVETVLWVFRAYRSHGFKLTYWPAQLDCWSNVMQKQLQEDTYHELYPFINWMIVNQALFVKESDAQLK